MQEGEGRRRPETTAEELREALLQRLLAQALEDPGEAAPTPPAREPEPPRRNDDETKAQIRALLARTYEFAAAVGACRCFGHPQCTRCGGQGRPGWTAPKEAAFLAYVAPALHRIGLLVEDEAADGEIRGESNDAVRL